MKTLFIMASLFISFTVSASTIDKTASIGSLKSSQFAGNILGASALGLANEVKFKELTGMKFGNCTLMKFVGFPIPKIKKGNSYGIISINETSEGVELYLANTFRWPQEAFLSCSGLNLDNSIQDLEEAAQMKIELI
jgi:hypothetical protein